MKSEHILCIALVLFGAIAIFVYRKKSENEGFYHPWRGWHGRRWAGRPGWKGYTWGYGYPFAYGGWPPYLYSY